MRITGGTARGRAVTAPDGLEVRPTASKVRQAFFNILGNNLSGSHFADFCAGSGLMGLEALSRGASSAVFVEENRRMVQVIRQNLKHLNFDGEVIAADVRKAIPILEPESFDVIFLDPPYAKTKLVETVIELVGDYGLLTAQGVLVIEHSLIDGGPQNTSSKLKQQQQRNYGQTAMTFYERT